MTDASFDPYRAPVAPLEREPVSRPTELRITENMLAALRQTRPWVLFLSILGFIGAGFMVLASVIMIGVAIMGAALNQGNDLPVPVTLGVSVIYLLLAVVYGIPCVSLIRYAISIGRIGSNNAEAFEEALIRQKSFWRMSGILTLVFIAVYFLAIIVAVIAAVAIGLAESM